jgi:putative DNA primase/helicase
MSAREMTADDVAMDAIIERIKFRRERGLDPFADEAAELERGEPGPDPGPEPEPESAAGERPVKLVWSKPMVRELVGAEAVMRRTEVSRVDEKLPATEPECKLEQIAEAAPADAEPEPEQPADDVLISEADAEPQGEKRLPNGGEATPNATPVHPKKLRRRETRALSNELVTEDQAALDFVRRYARRLRFDHDAGKWREWNGSIWRENRTGLAFHWARELARDLAKTEPDKVRYISSKTSFAAGVERFARSDPAFAVTSDKWDKDPFLLGTPDGTVDLRSGILRPGDPEDGITKATLVAPSPEANCPRWRLFLREATGDDADLIRFLQQWCGYCLTGSIQEHALAFLHGGGGEGKSTFVNTVAKIMGDYAATADMDTFVASDWSRHTTELAMLRGARLVTASETEEGRQWAEARIKTLTGGDPITARFMRQDNFTFEPQFKLTIVGNHRPALTNVDDAMRRRLSVVPFTRKPLKPDQTLPRKLLGEAPGILRWMIDGCLDWQANGLMRPSVVTVETADYFSEQDSFAHWLAETCDCEPGNPYKWEKVGDLWNSWRQFAAAANEPTGTMKSFSGNLTRHGFEKHKGTGGVRQFRGLRLKRATCDWNDER